MSSPSIAILKIGGSVLVDAAAYARAAEFVDQRLAEEPGAKLIVVVSAEQGVTDALLEIARGMCSTPDPRMVDLLWSTGELKAVALLALALQSRGVRLRCAGQRPRGVTSFSSRSSSPRSGWSTRP